MLEAAWKPPGEALELLARISWHPLTVRYLRGELEVCSRWRGTVGGVGRVGGVWAPLDR